MKFLHLWEGRTSRLSYLAALIVSSAGIAVLPFIVGVLTLGLASRDPAFAILRSLVSMALLGIGFVIASVPLLFFARRRMRELGLSGAWLLLFPIAPLQTLFWFAILIASSPVTIWPLPVNSPLTSPMLWVELAFGALLAVLPAGNHLEGSSHRSLRFAHDVSTCDGRLNRQAFFLRLAIALGLIYIIPIAAAMLGRTTGMPLQGALYASILMGPSMAANGFVTILVMMFVASATVRRLHDLDLRGWWIIFFPLGLLSMLSSPFLLMNPQVILYLGPLMWFSIVQGLGCLAMLVLLLFKPSSNFGNSYGPPPLDRGNGAYVPV